MKVLALILPLFLLIVPTVSQHDHREDINWALSLDRIYPGVGRVQAAHLLECNAARPHTMDKDHSVKSIWQVKHNGMSFLNWETKTIANYLWDRRRIWYGNWAWVRSDQAFDHCKWDCLMPAMSWGMDSAFCRLRTSKHGASDRRITVGYTNTDNRVCDVHDDGSGDCSDHKEWPLREYKLVSMLQEHDGTVANMSDVWRFPLSAEKIEVSERAWWQGDRSMPLWNSEVYVDHDGDPPIDKAKQRENEAKQRKKAWNQIMGIITGGH